MKDLIKVEKCLSYQVIDDEITKIFKSGFVGMYYVIEECSVDVPLEIEFVTEEELCIILELTTDELHKLFES